MSSAPTRPVEVPPYQLQVLVDSVLDDFAEIIGAASDPHMPPTQVNCVQALGRDLYVGCANGRLIRFALQEHPHRSRPAGYRFVSQQLMPGNKPVDAIALAPTVQKMLVQSDGRIFFYVFPGMEPVPTSLIAPIRSVVTFAMDAGPSDVHPPSVRFAVLKRTGMSLYTLRERLFHEKEGQLQGVPLAKRYGRHLCVCNADRTYCMVNLETLNLLEMIPSSQDGKTIVKPSITVIGENEFLVLSWLGENAGGAVGLFMTGDADPVRGTMQWTEYPEAICVDYPYIISLLPNRSIEVHNLLTLEIVQVITPPIPSPVFLDPRSLVGSAGFSVPSSHRIEKLSPTPMLIVSPPPPSSPVNGKHELKVEPAGSGLTPPPTPRHPDTTGANDTSRPPAYTRSGVVVLGPNGLQSLVPTTLISQADALLESNRLQDAIELAEQTEQAQRRLSRGMMGVEDDTAEELRYVYQRIGYACLAATRFEEAGNYLFRGNLDPRLLLRHFPDLRPSPLLVPPEATVDAYAGIAERVKNIGSVEDIIMNYSPHIGPDDTAIVKLKDVLVQNARTMLQTFLRKSRNKRLFEPGGANRDVSKVVDTLLLRLLAETGDMQEMQALVAEADDTLILPDVVPVLTQYQRYAVLAGIYERRRETGKLLDLLAMLVQNKWSSETMPDPMGRLLRVLDDSRDRALLQKWGLWLVKRDAERGINVLMAARDVSNKRGLPKGIAENADATLLKQIRDASQEAADQYLEYLVLQKRSTDAALHTQLAERYVTDVLGLLDNEVVLHEFELAVSSYRESARAVPFLAHVAFDTPDTDGKRARLKLALFLQGSSLFDVAAVQRRLEPRSDVLAFECAILDGKLGQHRSALEMLALKLRDASSAEAYCSLNGIVIPPRLAHSIAERAGLQAWAALLGGPKTASRRPTLRPPGDANANRAAAEEAEEGGQKHDLVNILMQVYMSSGAGAYDQTAKLLNAQAVHLDVVDVMSEVPPTWPIAKLSSFLSRSLRRTLHARHEGMIIKAISAGQNLEATDAAYVHTLGLGAVIEEANPPDGIDPLQEVKDVMMEKVAEKVGHAGEDHDGVHEFHDDDLA